eukprot:9220180-Pyramimonas_sp.AAC.1
MGPRTLTLYPRARQRQRHAARQVKNPCPPPPTANSPPGDSQRRSAPPLLPPSLPGPARRADQVRTNRVFIPPGLRRYVTAYNTIINK